MVAGKDSADPESLRRCLPRSGRRPLRAEVGMSKAPSKYQLYCTDSGHNTTMREQMAVSLCAASRARKALDKIKDDGVKVAAIRRFNEGLDAIRMYYISDDELTQPPTARG